MSFTYRERAKQLIDFDGIFDEGKLSATDIDGFIEYHNECYIFTEIKGKGKSLPYGQRLAFERLADDLSKVKPTIVIVAEHDTEDTETDIVFKDTIVREFRYKGQWLHPETEVTTKQAIKAFIKKVEGDTK